MVEDARWGKREGKVLHLKTCRRKITGKTSRIMKWEMRQGEKLAEDCSRTWRLPSSPCHQSHPLVPFTSRSPCGTEQFSLNIFLFTAFVALFPGQHFASVLKTYCPFSKTKKTLVWKDLFQMSVWLA